MSSLRRLFSSSVGTKLLIGLTGLCFSVPLLHWPATCSSSRAGTRQTRIPHAHLESVVVPSRSGLVGLFLRTSTRPRDVGCATVRRVPSAMRSGAAGHTSRRALLAATMILDRLLTLVFVGGNLQQFKFGAWYEAGDPPIRDLTVRKPRSSVSPPGWALTSLHVLVGLHLRHGIASAFQSLGADHPILHETDCRAGHDRGDRNRRGLRRDPGLGVPDAMTVDSKVPAARWPTNGSPKFESKLVSPANRRKYSVIIVGTGLAGASAASSLGELGYNVKSFCIHDSARRAHSIAAQGASTPQELPERTATASSGCSTTRSGGRHAPARRMSSGSRS